MNILVISTCGAVGRYFVNRLSAVHPIECLIQVRLDPAFWARRRRGSFLDRAVRAVERRAFYRRLYERQERYVARELAVAEENPLPVSAIEPIAASQLNRPATARVIQQYRPDLVWVCCAPLLSRNIYGLARLATLNVHFGRAPAYRGEHTIFWPLVRRDYANVGVTIHQINDGIDAGLVWGRAQLAVEPGDNESTLTVKAARSAADLAAEITVAAARGPLTVASPLTAERGQQFNFASRRIWHDARLWLSSRRGFSQAEPIVERYWRRSTERVPPVLFPASAAPSGTTGYSITTFS